MLPKLQTVLTTVGQFIAVMVALTPIGIGVYHVADAHAQDYINHAVDKRFADFSTKVEGLTASINRLVQGQSAETGQS